MKVKLCGLRREADIMYANRYLPDYAGFVFAKSPRQVSGKQAAALIGKLDSRIRSVGVFVNEPLDSLEETARVAGLDVLQLHGDEDAAYVARAKELGYEVWKAVRVRSGGDIQRAQTLGADLLLLDSFSKEAYGGTGKKADWDVIARVELTQPFFLAGGLNSANISEALQKVTPLGLDISGGIETNGFKDEAKIREIMGVLGRL
ncbi:phosphoribosylanthranilate isomerase [Christensenella hongkongensis]|uniref:phosphoribosylanthranilate isomerase n=1 Tax=Christensenella hongkongensis TaxID=270498 RepID=UPI0026739A13|nr:phosphoribosylanthranilate isomerase [Christensenella hongkongensis]